MKLVVCESCDAEFAIKHHLETRLYKVAHCPFCGDDLNEELEDCGHECHCEGNCNSETCGCENCNCTVEEWPDNPVDSHQL